MQPIKAFCIGCVTGLNLLGLRKFKFIKENNLKLFRRGNIELVSDRIMSGLGFPFNLSFKECR